MKIQRLGVVGAGVIGSGVAQIFAETGHTVVLIDNDKNQLAVAREAIRKNVRNYSLLKKGIRHPSDVLNSIEFTDSVASIGGVDFVIENITEDWNLKRQVHEDIERYVNEDTPIAANTSAIPITRIASIGRHPHRVLGMHFMNPVPLMPVVEVIRGSHTSDTALQSATSLVEQAGLKSIIVNDSPGFVTNRVMMLMVNEAIFLVHEGVASALDIDRLFKTCFGHRMGPLETADLIGLDTVLRSIEVIYEELNDSKYRPCPLLKKMVYADTLGRKTGKGFYEYGL